jgi:phosphatidylglycerophosphate synthase
MTAGDASPFLARAVDFRRRYQHPEGLFWLKRVNHALGALIAFVLFPTRATPNMLTFAGLAAHVLGAVLVALATPPAPIWLAVVVVLLWQLAFSLDCADGPLARARGTGSDFGAWLDQLIDIMSHAAVYTSLAVYLVRALAPDPAIAVLLGCSAVSLSLLQTFSTWQRTSIMGGSVVDASPSTAVRLLHGGRHLIDYGFFLFLVAATLPWPELLLVVVAASAALNALYIAAQLALNYRRHRRESRERATAGTGRSR